MDKAMPVASVDLITIFVIVQSCDVLEGLRDCVLEPPCFLLLARISGIYFCQAFASQYAADVYRASCIIGNKDYCSIIL